MKKWQDECNYRREKDSKGNVSACFIEADGTDVEVSQEVYHSYASQNRRERYAALLKLKDADRELITGLFFDGIFVREYAKMTGVSDMAVRKRRDRILKRLQKFFR